MENALVLQDLCKSFGSTEALRHVSYSVAKGEIFGLLGHNGAGKTTTVRLANGVLSPTAGEARVFGLSPMTAGPAIRQRCGVLTETPALDERLSARANLTIYAVIYGLSDAAAKARVHEMLATFELADRADERVAGFSKGMKQRLALARTLLHSPELIFLDEPTSGLDPVSAHHVHGMIRRFSHDEGRTVFICTHNLVEAQELCDRVAVMEHGQIIALGTPDELRRRYGVHQQVEIEIDPGCVAQAEAGLAAFPGVRAVTRANGARLAATGIPRESIPRLIAALSAAGIALYRVAPVEPTLEDVYLALNEQGALHEQGEVEA